MLLKRSQLARILAEVTSFPTAKAAKEQVATPPELAADLLLAALGRGDIEGREVADLGSGTGRLAIGSALLGAARVTGLESDPEAIRVSRAATVTLHTKVRWVDSDVASFHDPVDTVVMNPPFGAQTRHADRPFWDQALTIARRAVYGFALADSRTFIARRGVARGARIEETLPVAWRLPRTFPHHRERSVTLAVDRWTLRVSDEE